MADDGMRPRPVPPPSVPERGKRNARVLRPVGALWAGTFAVVAQRWRDLAVAAIVGAALWLGALVAAFVGVDELFDGQFWQKIDALFSGDIETSAEVDAWLTSFDFTLTPQAVSLLLVSLLAIFFSDVQAAASAQIARQQLTGIDAGGGAAMSVALSRLPVLLFMNVVFLAIEAVILGVGLGLHSATYSLGDLWDLATFVVSAVVVPLLTILWVMAYLEPGMPSLRRWGQLLGRNKLATWGRVMLFAIVSVVVEAAVFVVALVSPLSFAYALAITIVLVWPVSVGIVTVAHVIIYGDLVQGLPAASDEAVED